MWCRVCGWPWMLLVCCGVVQAAVSPHLLPSTHRPRVCRSMDIKNRASNLSVLKDCNVIEGYLRIVLMEKTTVDDFKDLSFPELREVTGNIIFYRVRGLTSIGRLFPNLRVIRGEDLFMYYSLVVYKMFSLKEIALPGLTVLRGGVIISENRELCYWKSVNWTLVAPNGGNKVDKNSEDCPACQCPSGFCWNESLCQVPKTESCDKECLGGCSGPGPESCNVCRAKIIDGVCKETCPPNTFAFRNRYCLTEEMCLSLNETYRGGSQKTSPKKEMIPFEGTCSENCPPKMMVDSEVRCKKCIRRGVWAYCKRVCDGLTVDTLESAQRLTDCTHINGTLRIQIKADKKELDAKELLKHLGKIEEISGQLVITESLPIVDLNFLESLILINGSVKKNGTGRNNALVIFNNPNLVKLWDWERKPWGKNLSIGTGSVSIQSNPKLCMPLIQELFGILGVTETYEYANGIFCNIKMTVSFVSKNESSVRVTVISTEQFSMDDRYVVYYREAEENSVAKTPDQNPCDDAWRIADHTEIESSKIGKDAERRDGIREVTYVLGNLKPYTKYAGFVKIYVAESQWGQTSVQYFRTLSGKPTYPTGLRAYSNSSHEIEVIWSPPTKPNGKISEYIVIGVLQEDEENFLKDRDYCFDGPVEQPVVGPTTAPVPSSSTPPMTTTDCCMKNRQEELCKEPTRRSLNYIPLDGQQPFDELQYCDNYIYDIIESNALSSLIPQKPISKFSDNVSGLNMIRDEDIKRKDLDKIPIGQGEFNDDGTLKKFIKTVPGNMTTIVIDNLRHYGIYIIEVKACRAWDSKEEKEKSLAAGNNELPCSHSSMVSLRTSRNPNADTIDQQQIGHNVQNKSVQVYWKKPINPNGIVVSYHIRYWRTDIHNSEPILKCIRAAQHEANGSQYSLENLDNGMYALTVQAISLYGEGPPSHQIHFDLTEHTNISVIVSLSVTFLIIGLVIIAGVGFLIYYRRKLIMENVLIALVNPEYSSLGQYVEDEWEVCRDNVEILQEIKQGNFGMVYEGLLLPDKRKCAVKTVIESASERDCIEFLNEAAVMKAFKGAYHIVNLLGVVSRTRPPLVVMELMALGDMKSYLRLSRNSPQYPTPTTNRLLIMAAQIADGMAFLEARKFVHRDLAARNCMVSEDLNIKIGDFGMTRDIYETDYYKKGNKGLLPIRWMSPESLNDGVFTTHSDVWSYGIVLWEMSTLASQPYQGMANEQVLQYVVSGNKLDIPTFCPQPLRPIMAQCWKWKPKLRPSFLAILSHLEDHVNDEFRQVSFYHSSEGMEARHLAEQAAINKSQESAAGEGPSLNTTI